MNAYQTKMNMLSETRSRSQQLAMLKVWLRPTETAKGRKAISFVIPANHAKLIAATLETAEEWGDRVGSHVSFSKVKGSEGNFTPKALLDEGGEFLTGNRLISAFRRLWNLA